MAATDDAQFVEGLATAARDAVRQSRRSIIADRHALQSITIEVDLDVRGQVTEAQSWIARRIPVSRQLGLKEGPR